MASSLSVSIVVYDLNAELLRATIDSLNSAIEETVNKELVSQWSVTIVDNGNNDSLIETLTDQNVQFIHNHQNLGYGAAHNQVIDSAVSDYHLILNPDVLIDNHCLTEAIQLLMIDRETVMIGPTGHSPEGEPAFLCKRFPSVLDLFLRGLSLEPLNSLFRQRLAHYEYQDLDPVLAAEVELVSGCFMFCRTKVLQNAGGFDNRYFLYFEDFDLSLRLSKRGKVKYAPAMKIIHYGGNTSKKGRAHILHFCRSAISFYRLHGWRWV